MTAHTHRRRPEDRIGCIIGRYGRCRVSTGREVGSFYGSGFWQSAVSHGCMLRRAHGLRCGSPYRELAMTQRRVLGGACGIFRRGRRLQCRDRAMTHRRMFRRTRRLDRWQGLFSSHGIGIGKRAVSHFRVLGRASGLSRRQRGRWRRLRWIGHRTMPHGSMFGRAGRASGGSGRFGGRGLPLYDSGHTRQGRQREQRQLVKRNHSTRLLARVAP